MACGRRAALIWLTVAALVLVALVVTLALTLREEPFGDTFLGRCKTFDGSPHGCEELWAAFENAYVGRDPCQVPAARYDDLIAAAPFTECDRMMFWSKTKDVVHDFTKSGRCFLTVEDTRLGFILDGLTWCGKEGSKKTFTKGCPQWGTCENNPVRSFWTQVSAAFADNACGNVSVMLNGNLETPFHPSSVFATVEIVRFRPPRVKSLNVVLVTQDQPVAQCENPSLMDLQKQLAPGITYTCTEVIQTRIEECGSDSNIACHACWG